MSAQPMAYVPPTPVSPEQMHFNYYLIHDPYCCGRGIVGSFRLDYNLPGRMRVEWQSVANNKQFLADLKQRFEMIDKSYLTCTTCSEEGQDVVETILALTGWNKDDTFINSNTNNEVTVWSFNKGYEKQEPDYDYDEDDGDY